MTGNGEEGDPSVPAPSLPVWAWVSSAIPAGLRSLGVVTFEVRAKEFSVQGNCLHPKPIRGTPRLWEQSPRTTPERWLLDGHLRAGLG